MLVRWRASETAEMLGIAGADPSFQTLYVKAQVAWTLVGTSGSIALGSSVEQALRGSV